MVESEEEEFYNKSFHKVGEPAIVNPFVRAKVGTLIFIISEIMLFGGLISSFFVVKSSYMEWPPGNLPTYPVWQTSFNSLFLFASGFTIWLFDKTKKDVYYLLTLVLGITFVILQGIEWARLVSYGLTMTKDRYGSIFYLVVGTHALHVAIGILWLALSYVYSKVKYKSNFSPPVLSSSLFWKFVVLVWPVIYVSVYIL